MTHRTQAAKWVIDCFAELVDSVQPGRCTLEIRREMEDVPWSVLDNYCAAQRPTGNATVSITLTALTPEEREEIRKKSEPEPKPYVPLPPLTEQEIAESVEKELREIVNQMAATAKLDRHAQEFSAIRERAKKMMPEKIWTDWQFRANAALGGKSPWEACSAGNHKAVHAHLDALEKRLRK